MKVNAYVNEVMLMKEIDISSHIKILLFRGTQLHRQLYVFEVVLRVVTVYFLLSVARNDSICNFSLSNFIFEL